MNKEDVAYIHSGILIRHKKEWNTAIYSMDGSSDYYTKWSKSDTERQISYIVYYVESKRQR